MSKTETPPADGAAPAKKKGKLKGLLIYGVAGLVLVGGGVGAGLYAAGSTAGGAAHAEEKDTPKLVPKGEGGHGESGGEEGGGHGGGGGEGEGGEVKVSEHPAPMSDAHPDPSKYEATYFTLEQPFTSNLQDSDGLIQVSLGVSTYYDAKVIENLKKHEMPVRSAILMALAGQDPSVLGTPEGKKALQATLTKSINETLRQKEGFGGIDDVYFTNFIIQ